MVDFVSFLRDSLLKDEEKEKVRRFREMCKETHGYVYQNLPLTNVELGATFEQEAAVWLSERDSESCGMVDKPKRRLPHQLHYKATYKVPRQFTESIQGAPNYNRVLREATDTIRAKLDYVTIYVCRDDIFFWKVIMQGPFGTPYESGRWMLYVHFNSEYPRHPPSIRFLTKIHHVNVSNDGRICHNIFVRGWSNKTTMIEVFENIYALLQEPNVDDPISIEKVPLKKKTKTNTNVKQKNVLNNMEVKV